MPLPDETKGSTAKALIARFQSNINTVDGADAPLKPRHSFGSNEALPGYASSSRGTSPRPSLDVNVNSAAGANGRLSTSPGAGGAGGARLTPAALDKLDKYRLDVPKVAAPGSTTTTATTAGSEAPDDKEGQTTSYNGETPSANAKEAPAGSKPDNTPVEAKKDTIAHTSEKIATSPTPVRTTPAATPSGKAPSASIKKEAPASPTTRKAEASTSSSQNRASPSKNNLFSDLSKSVSRKVISPLPDTPERQTRSNGAASSSPSVNRVRTPITSTSSPSTSRLMQPTAASRARVAGDEVNKLSSSVSAGQRNSTTAAVHARPATSMSGTSPTTRFRRIASESDNGSASGNGRRASSSHADSNSTSKTLSPAQLGRLAAAEATGVHSPATSRVRKQSLPSSRSRSSLAMAREASHETPTKGARQTPSISSSSITPGRAKVNPAASASTSTTTPQARPASTTSTPSSSTFSRLSKPTASSLAHAKSASPSSSSPSSSSRKAQAPETPLSASSPARSTPGSSAKATVGSRLPPARAAQASPLSGVKGGPKIGVVTGPKKLELKPRPKEPAKPEVKQEEKPNLQNAETVSKIEGVGPSEQDNEAADVEASASNLDDIPDIPSAEPSEEQLKETESKTAHMSSEETERKEEESTDQSVEPTASSSQPQADPPTIVEPVQHESDEAQPAEGQEKVFTGWSNRPYGKIGIPLHADPAQIPENVGGPVEDSSTSPKATSPPQATTTTTTTTTTTEFSDKWGTREGGNLPSPRAVSPAMSPTASADSQTGETKKVPIWLRKGGV